MNVEAVVENSLFVTAFFFCCLGIVINLLDNDAIIRVHYDLAELMVSRHFN